MFIVTGGASGLGAGTARALAQAGGKVVIADLNDAAGTALAQEIGGRFVRCDVTSETDGQAVVQAATSLGTLAGLVNCAGIAPASRTVGKTGPHPLDQFARVININLIGTFNMIRLAATAMAANPPNAGGERGVIINTAIGGGIRWANRPNPPIAGPKAGLVGKDPWRMPRQTVP
ncbi:SDR family oxidoreductase, partial [Ralstonia solanacearum]|uniref:SDR family oxidoreductase n=1 Tax=Ralstonia solanacearum TaxID=305 RepID=UPI001F4984D5